MALLSLVAKLGLDKTGFEQGLNSATKRASAFGSSLKATLAGAFGTAALVAFAKDIAQTVGRIKDLSEQFGVTTDDVQNIDYAMKQSGMSFEDFGNAMNKLAPTRKEAALGNKELADTFLKFGVTAKDLQNPLLSNKDILIKVSEAMRGMNMTAADQARIMDLLGPRAARLATVLAQLEGFQAPSLFSEQDIVMVDQMSKEFDLFYRDVQISGIETGKVLIDVFSDVFTFITTLFSKLDFKKLIFTGGNFPALVIELTKQLRKGVDAALEETAQQAAQREENRANAMAQREKERADAKAKREDELRNAGRLFEQPDKQKADAKQQTFGKGLEMPATDQLGRIGAFSGGGVGTLEGQMKKTADTLVEIRNVLAVRGIVIKDL